MNKIGEVNGIGIYEDPTVPPDTFYLTNMKIENRETQTFEEKTVHDGSLKISIENDGTVSVSGYLYRSDGKEGNNQMEYLQEVAKLLPQMVASIKNKKLVKPKKKTVLARILQTVWHLFVFGGIGVVMSQTITHNLLIGFIASFLVLIGAIFYRKPIKF